MPRTTVDEYGRKSWNNSIINTMQAAAEEGRLQMKFEETSKRDYDDIKSDDPSDVTLNYTVGKPLEVYYINMQCFNSKV